MNFARLCALAALSCATFDPLQAAERKLPLEAPVKILSAPAPAQPAMPERPGQRPPLTPTTPGGKLPQYQLGHRQRQIPSHDDIQNPSTRFFLALPESILLVEAALTIDELPFPAVREQRVQRLLRDVVADSSVAPDESPVVDRLRQSMGVTGKAPSVDEVRWVLSNWVDGPTLLLLKDDFQRVRAYQRPEVIILDLDRDGTVSAAEIDSAVRSFQDYDLNWDGIIQFTEIARAANDVRDTTLAVPARLVTLLPDASTAAAAFQRLVDAGRSPKERPAALSRFDRNGNGRFDADELAEMRTSRADLSLTIAFNSKQPDKSRLALTAVATEFAEAVQRATVDHLGITLSIGGVAVNFQAVQAGPGDQISIGSVDDGYPLLPDLDLNDDGRLTVRELRGVPGRLSRFDRNHDGKLSLDEIRAPIRVCFGLGPTVHRELAGIRSVHPRPGTPAPSGPEWFVRMDRNKDNDLTRGEFPGTDEQFAAIDADGDELISVDEALAFDNKANGGRSGNLDQPAISTGANSKEP
jgi:Ca2+-binding EF-hand superfamily protein